jgi:hypothetical protein
LISDGRQRRIVGIRNTRIKRTQAPRLANGDSRVKDYGRLPESIKEGLRDIARMEGKSMSWVKEEVIIAFFHLRRPQYVKPESKLKIVARKRA